MIEITPIEKLDASFEVPGSKYIANRVLIAAALAEGTSTIQNVPNNEDISAAILSLQKLGVEIKKENSKLEIKGTGGKLRGNCTVDVSNSGTLYRFICAAACLSQGKVEIEGSKRITERPIDELIDALRQLGINCKKAGNSVTIDGGKLKGGNIEIDGSKSSQFVSALLLALPFAENGTKITVKNLASGSYVDLTIGIMEEFGVNVERKQSEFIIRHNQKYEAREFFIPGDWASANYFFAAAAITGGKARINDLDRRIHQPESDFLDLLIKMGCKVEISSNSITVSGGKKLNAIEADMSSMPDSVQTLCSVALFAEGTTKITKILHLEHKESNRINDTIIELKKLGADAKQIESGIEIRQSKISPAILDSHNDHRMAMSLALIGLKIPGIKIQNEECVNKSFPQFWEILDSIGAIKNE